MAIYTDNFTGVDGTELHTYNAIWVDAGDAHNILIQSNGIRTISGAGFHAYLYNNTFSDKHYAKLAIGSNRFIGPGVRVASGQNYFYCFASTYTLSYPGQVVAGTPTDFDSGQAQVNVNDVVELAIDASVGTTIYYKVNGSVVQTYTGKSALTGGQGGITGYDGGESPYCTGDTWEGGDVGGVVTTPPRNPMVISRMAINRASVF